MKEVLTKSFWQGVKKTYDDALKGETPAERVTPPAEGIKSDAPQDEAPVSIAQPSAS